MTRRGHLERAVSAMLRDRRPPGFDATEEEARQLRAAALLRSGHPGSDLPRPEFIDGLAGRLRRSVETGGSGAAALPARRTFLRRAGLAAAAVVAGAGVDRAVSALRDAGTPATEGTMVPDTGAWTAVASLDAVRSVPALRFRSGAVEGVLVARADGGVDALSAVCTHLGCLLTVDAPARRLACPCHNAHFALDGTPQDREYLRPLPRLSVRVQGSSIEVFAPAPATT